MSEHRLLVLVLTDSLAFVGPRMAHPIDEPQLWPNVMAGELDVDVQVFGGFGWTARDGWYALGHDPRLWAVMRRADAVVLALGQFDTTPAPLPNFLWKLIPLIRSAPRRRIVAAVHLRAVRVLTRLFSHLPGGGPVSLAPRLTVEYLQGCVTLLRRKRPGVPVVSISPVAGRPRVYSRLHPGHPAGERAVRAWATVADVPLLDLASLDREHGLTRDCNPDGMHLGWSGHHLLGSAMAGMVAAQLGERVGPNDHTDSGHDAIGEFGGQVRSGRGPEQRLWPS